MRFVLDFTENTVTSIMIMITNINNKNAPFTYFTSTEIITQKIMRFYTFKIIPRNFRRFKQDQSLLSKFLSIRSSSKEIPDIEMPSNSALYFTVTISEICINTFDVRKYWYLKYGIERSQGVLSYSYINDL